MASRHLDKLTREFLSGSSNPYSGFDPVKDLQDPTYLSFKIDFFPDLGLSMPSDTYSTGGLLRPFGNLSSSALDYSFYDSAAEYLARIGAPTRQAQLEKFIQLLFELQEKAPWYFQSVSGLSDLYKIDPAMNFRGKDKVLTVDCLETIDMRMSLLSDLYRNVAFDFEGMREVLPVNLRTFNMNIHVLEFRKFNTTFGIIADHYKNRTTKGQDKQQDTLDAERKNVFSTNNSALATGALNNLQNLGADLNAKLGGMFSNLGEQAGSAQFDVLDEAFEAISVQTFSLKDCEFDFYSEAPSYLDTVSVKDINEATHKFKINVGKIEKVGVYSFYDYVISEITRNTRMAKIDLARSGTDYSTSEYFEKTNIKSNPSNATGANGLNPAFSNYNTYRKGIFDDADSSVNSKKKELAESDKLRTTSLESALSGIFNNASRALDNEINKGLGALSGGVVGTTPLRNVYKDNPAFIDQATTSINAFLTPGTQIDNGTSAVTPSQVLKNINLTGATPPTDSLGNVFIP